MTRRVMAALAFGLIGTAILIALGVWQLQRLEWKEGIIAGLEARFAVDPVPLPADPDPLADAFLRVAVEGRLGEEELHVLTSQKPHGPGFRVIAPVETADGRRVMADLGYVPEAMKSPSERSGPSPGPIRLTGSLYWPEETDVFTPEPDAGRNIWFARDLRPMAAALGAEPLLIVAEGHNLGSWPKPLRLGINLPNDHLEYALTWFSLAAIWAVMSTLLVRRESRRARA